jgi:hypothetical protein
MSDATGPNLDQALLQQLEQAITGKPAVAQELRRHMRYPKNGQIQLHVSYQRAPLLAQLRDVSAGGIGFEFREAMDIGTTFTIVFITDGATRSVKYKVVRCRRVERGRFEIGAEIIHITRDKKSN